jgi:hypothetical protein
MTEALKDVPDHPFPVPSGVKFSRICADTGRPPDVTCKRAIDECFVEGTEVPQAEQAAPDNNLGDFYESELGGSKAAPTPAAATATARPKAGTDGYNADGSQGF